MTDEEKVIFDKDLKKAKYAFLGMFSLIVIILLSVNNCTNNKYNQLKGEYKQLNNTYIKQKDGVVIFHKNRIIEKDSLTQEIKKREISNKSLVMNNQELQTKINSIKNRKSTVLKTDPCYEVAVKAEEGENCLEIIPLKDKQLENKDIQITNLESDKIDITKQLIKSEEENSQRQLLQEFADKNIDNLKHQVQTLNTKNTINKILIPAAVIIGGVAGYKLVK